MVNKDIKIEASVDDDDDDDGEDKVAHYKQFALYPSYIRVSLSVGSPDIEVESTIINVNELDFKISLLLNRIMETASVIKLNKWEQFSEDVEKSHKEYEKMVKKLEREQKKKKELKKT